MTTKLIKQIIIHRIMGNFCSKCGEKADANEKYRPKEETHDNKHNITIVTNQGNTVEKQTSLPDKNDSNNAGSTSVIVSDNRQPSGQKPDVSESHVADQKLDVSVSTVTDREPDLSNVIDQKPQRSFKKKKRRDAESSDSSETSDSSSDTDSSDDDCYWKKSRRKYKNKHGGTTLVSKKMKVMGNYMNIGHGAKNVTLTITNDPHQPPINKKPADKMTRFEPFNERTRMEFFSHKSQQRHNAGNFIYLPENSKGRVEEVMVTELKVAWEKSVCRIKYPGGSGTGFRVGCGNRNLLCTANHVVEGIIDTGMTSLGQSSRQRKKLDDGDVWCVFNHLTDDFSVSDNAKFYFQPFVHYSNDETDIAILELKNNQYGTPMPQAFINFATPALEEPFHLIGHPNGGKKKWCLSDYFINVNSPETVKHIDIVKGWCQDKNLICEADFVNKLDNPKRWLFHVAENFTKGASGCPGLVIKPPDVYVVTVLLRGYPDWFYEPVVPDEIKGTLPSGYRVEQGTNLEALYWDMKVKEPDLCKEVFRQ